MHKLLKVRLRRARGPGCGCTQGGVHAGCAGGCAGGQVVRAVAGARRAACTQVQEVRMSGCTQGGDARHRRLMHMPPASWGAAPPNRPAIWPAHLHGTDDRALVMVARQHGGRELGDARVLPAVAATAAAAAASWRQQHRLQHGRRQQPLRLHLADGPQQGSRQCFSQRLVARVGRVFPAEARSTQGGCGAAQGACAGRRAARAAVLVAAANREAGRLGDARQRESAAVVLYC